MSNLSQQHSTEITQQQRLNIVQTSLENTHHPSTTFKPHHSTSFCSFSTSLKINSAHHSTQTSNTEQFRSTTQTYLNKTHHPSTSLNKLHHPSTSLKKSPGQGQGHQIPPDAERSSSTHCRLVRKRSLEQELTSCISYAAHQPIVHKVAEW